MKSLAPRSPRRKGLTCWSRAVDEHGVVWRLFRRDETGKPHHLAVAYSGRIARSAVARDLLKAKRALRDRVDEIDLTLMEAA